MIDLKSLFSQKKILLIGDSIIDDYVYGKALGISAETPTVVARQVNNKLTLGGAFLVCRNILQMQGNVSFITLTGSDKDSEYIKEFSHKNLKLFSIEDNSRITTVKRRFWVDNYKLLQFDQIDNKPIDGGIRKQILTVLENQIPKHDIFIVSDYRHGLLSNELIKDIIFLTKKNNIPIYVDSQLSQSSANHLCYKGATLFCLNKKEARNILPQFSFTKEDFHQLLKELDTKNIVVKDGDKGAKAFINGKIFQSRALPINAIDTCGAGDAFLAAFSLCNLLFPENALKAANYWAGLSTSLHGTIPPQWEDFITLFKKEPSTV